MKNRNRVCQHHGIYEESKGKCNRSELREDQFQAEQNRKIRMRTLTSHASQVLSSKTDCSSAMGIYPAKSGAGTDPAPQLLNQRVLRSSRTVAYTAKSRCRRC